MGVISDRLLELRDRGLHRRTRLVSGPQGPHVIVDGRPALLLCSNNYLGLADHPRVREAASDAAMRWGVGAGSSRLVSGTMTVHRRLEERLAAFEGTQSALLFGSGYLANTGVIAALTEPGSLICSDELNHASLIDGCRLSSAETFVYRHGDLEHLAWGLGKANGRPALIVTDSVFSMDGDVAPLEGIVELAHSHGARTVIDEAHATGVMGPGGRGAVADAGLTDHVDVVIGTLGKALGSYGAYAACSNEMSDWLTNRARTLIFSTAPPPPAIAGAMEALTILEEEPRRVDRLRRNGQVMRQALRDEGFDMEEQPTPIIPLIVGSASNAIDLCEEALARGLYAQAIRPPTVPAGTSRLRLSVMATHKPEELRKAAKVISRACEHAGLRAAAPEERDGTPSSASSRRAPGDDGAAISASRGPAPELFDIRSNRPSDVRRAA
ncbi:MAG: 8-amino-7-oxononanoate synthase [Actinomycetes bacterium]